jgi:hypothetical protein
MTHAAQIGQWLDTHPKEAAHIARHAVLGLWCGNGDSDPETIDLEADFPSGADYISHVSEAIEATGCFALITEISKPSTDHSAQATSSLPEH